MQVVSVGLLRRDIKKGSAHIIVFYVVTSKDGWKRLHWPAKQHKITKLYNLKVLFSLLMSRCLKKCKVVWFKDLLHHLTTCHSSSIDMRKFQHIDSYNFKNDIYVNQCPLILRAADEEDCPSRSHGFSKWKSLTFHAIRLVTPPTINARAVIFPSKRSVGKGSEDT